MKYLDKIKTIYKQFLTLILVGFSLLHLTACAASGNENQVVLSILSDPKTFNAVLSQESPKIFGLTYEG